MKKWSWERFLMETRLTQKQYFLRIFTFIFIRISIINYAIADFWGYIIPV